MATANPLKGEVPVPAGSGTYRLVYSINALIIMEDKFKKPVEEMGDLLQAGLNLRQIRTLFWIGLQEFHEGIDEKGAGRIVGEIGMVVAGELIAKAFMGAFGDGKPATDSPPQAPAATPEAAGTGAEATVSG